CFRAVARDPDLVGVVRAVEARDVVALAAVDVHRNRRRDGRGGGDRVRPAERLHGQPVERGLAAEDADAPGDDAVVGVAHLDAVCVVRPAGNDRIGGAVRGEVDVDLRALEGIDGDGVRAADRGDRHGLDRVDVHRDARDVPRETHAVAVRRDRDLLGDVRAVERERVVAALPSTTSLPSPGSHWKVSFPGPSVAVSAPTLPSTKSSPGPPLIVSAPEPPSSLSSPGPPFRSIGSVRPFPILTSSSPAPAATEMPVNVLRLKVKSTVPSSPTSTTSIDGPLGETASLSLAPSPVILSVPAWTFAVTAAFAWLAPKTSATAPDATRALTTRAVMKLLLRS